MNHECESLFCEAAVTMCGITGTAFVFLQRQSHCVNDALVWPLCISRMCVCVLGRGVWGWGLGVSIRVSDRREHLSEKHTRRQLIHYSVNGGIIQAGGVSIHISRVCVCVCPLSYVCVYANPFFHDSCSSEMWARHQWINQWRNIRHLKTTTATWGPDEQKILKINDVCVLKVLLPAWCYCWSAKKDTKQRNKYQ